MLRVPVEQLLAEEAADSLLLWDGHGNILATPIEARATNKESNVEDDKNKERILATGWEEVAKASASSGAWLKWTPGQIIQVNVFGKPVFFEKTFEDGPKRRVRVDAFVPGEGVKLWEMAPTVLRDLAEERAAVKNPFEDALFSVKRIGDGMKTTYKMRYERQLTPQEIATRSDAAHTSGASSAPDPF